MSSDNTPADAAPTTDAARLRAFWRAPRRADGQSVTSGLAGLARLNRRPHVRRMRALVRLCDALERLTRVVLKTDGDALTADMRADLIRLVKAVRASALRPTCRPGKPTTWAWWPRPKPGRRTPPADRSSPPSGSPPARCRGGELTDRPSRHPRPAPAMPSLADRVRTVMTCKGRLVRRSGDVRAVSWDGRTWRPEHLQDGGRHAFPTTRGDERTAEGRRALRHLRPVGRV